MSAVTEHPIIFSGAMVRAIVAGRKTVTRRVVKPQPANGCRYEMNGAGDRALHLAGTAPDLIFVPAGARSPDHRLACPYGAPGDRLWVRETWHPCDGRPIYAADYDGDKAAAGVERWVSPLFMPRDASRITLEIVSVRVERLQEITEEDARAEGVTPFRADPEGDCWSDGKYRTAFEYLWGEINGWPGERGARAPWSSNPWVWRVEFRRVT